MEEKSELLKNEIAFKMAQILFCLNHNELPTEFQVKVAKDVMIARGIYRTIDVYFKD